MSEAMTLDDYRNQARERYFFLTPYRLGFVIGDDDGDPALCPYEGPHTVKLFHQGYRNGQEHRQKLAQGGTG